MQTNKNSNISFLQVTWFEKNKNPMNTTNFVALFLTLNILEEFCLRVDPQLSVINKYSTVKLLQTYKHWK